MLSLALQSLSDHPPFAFYSPPSIIGKNIIYPSCGSLVAMCIFDGAYIVHTAAPDTAPEEAHRTALLLKQQKFTS